MRITIDPILLGIPFKGDEDIFKKPDFSSEGYVQSKPPYNDISRIRILCQPLKDTFEKVKQEQKEEVEECKDDKCE